MQAIAAIRRPLPYLMQKHQMLAMFHGVEVDITNPGLFIRQPSQLEIMGGKQRQGARYARQVGSAGSG